jgi:hypothetical protein
VADCFYISSLYADIHENATQLSWLWHPNYLEYSHSFNRDRSVILGITIHYNSGKPTSSRPLRFSRNFRECAAPFVFGEEAASLQTHLGSERSLTKKRTNELSRRPKSCNQNWLEQCQSPDCPTAIYDSLDFAAAIYDSLDFAAAIHISKTKVTKVTS